MDENGTDPGQSLVDVLSDDGTVLEVVTRRQLRSGRLLHRCCAVLVLGSDNRLLVHRRSVAKDLWPLRWDLAAGGVVEHGEDPGTAARRELEEELGVSAPLHPLGVGRHSDADVDVFMHVWWARHDGPFTFTDGEVDEVRWVDAGELTDLLHLHEWCTDSVAVALPLLRQLQGWSA